jgi:monoamine oxidase
VWTVRERGSNGRHGELGGEFIDAEQREIRDLCEQLRVPLRRVAHAGFTHRYRGNDGNYHVSRTRPWAELDTLVAPLRRLPAAEIATYSLRDWLRQQNATTEQHAMADALRGFFLADPEELSVLAVVEQLARGGSPAQAEMYCIDGGNDRLIEALARDTDARVLLRHRVAAIAHAVDRVVVTVIDEAGLQQQLEADAVLMTLPASTLADVPITPALPDDQARAIRMLRYGCATKAVVQMAREPFRGRARAFATDTALGAFWQSSDGVLTFLAGGSASHALKARAAKGPQALLADLCWLGMNSTDGEETQTVTWEDDPFARGGYAYADPAFDPAWRPLLGRRAGRIHFAGEHTSERWQGYMNGAVASALRAVPELIESF